jgi:hypothetical protein
MKTLLCTVLLMGTSLYGQSIDDTKAAKTGK